MNVDNFFGPTEIQAIDDFLKKLTDKGMPEEIASYTQNQVKDCQDISETAVISNNVSIKGNVYIGENVTIQDYAVINGPVMIFDGAFIGQHSLIRNGSVVGKNSIIGHSCEIANTMILSNTTISHYNVVSNSLVGSNVNFSAFASTASFLLKNKEIHNLNVPVILHNENYEFYPANCYKFGAIIGDNCRIGAFTLLNPGVIMERNCIVYPLLSIPANYYHKDSSIHTEEYAAKFIIQIGERMPTIKENSSSSHIKAEKIDD